MVAHSYAGLPATQGLTNANNVAHIVYLASFQMNVGDWMLRKNPRGELLPWAKLRHREGVDDFVEAMTPETVFFNDLDASMRQPLTETAWNTIPNTYVICEADNAVPVFAQEMMAERADHVERLNTSHSPFLSQPAALARLIRRSLVSPGRESTAMFAAARRVLPY